MEYFESLQKLEVGLPFVFERLDDVSKNVKGFSQIAGEIKKLTQERVAVMQAHQNLADSEESERNLVMRSLVAGIRLADIVANRAKPLLQSKGKWDINIETALYAFPQDWLTFSHEITPEEQNLLGVNAPQVRVFELLDKISLNMRRQRREMDSGEYALLTRAFIDQMTTESDNPDAQTQVVLQSFMTLTRTTVKEAYQRNRRKDSQSRVAERILKIMDDYQMHTLMSLMDPNSPDQEAAMRYIDALNQRSDEEVDPLIQGAISRYERDHSFSLIQFFKGIREQGLYGEDDWFMQKAIAVEHTLLRRFPSWVIDSLSYEHYLVVGEQDKVADSKEIMEAYVQLQDALPRDKAISGVAFTPEEIGIGHESKFMVVAARILATSEGMQIRVSGLYEPLSVLDRYLQNTSLELGKRFDLLVSVHEGEVHITPIVVDPENIDGITNQRLSLIVGRIFDRYLEETHNDETKPKIIVPEVRSKGPEKTQGKKDKTRSPASSEGSFVDSELVEEVEQQRYRPQLVLSQQRREDLEGRFTAVEMQTIETKIAQINRGLGRMKMLKAVEGPNGERVVSFRLSRRIRMLAELHEDNQAVLYKVIWRREL
ncbi:hypothetical protein A2801_00730 [Candidatus Woesebacteria bacterium RIFCSPHIGHO2_01_FULL_41_10]|uniref:Uncharacterized protein n=1 Tax=Candidatus Woesebacteria bacterium RIFCSPHIGHO2_01_FULL_41_10 TaxID=1802500 RepID=A0A1F7YMY2_9BACT|nr:MAG: hypothetical protein A2801_00730 [Candidatus Woesebacteria bacterium RIFCSPHIGHO2_01_FULL_41_10]